MFSRVGAFLLAAAASLAPLPAAGLQFFEFDGAYPDHWVDAFSDHPTGFRLSTGSVTTTAMYAQYDLKLQKDLWPWWRIKYRWRYLSNWLERNRRDDIHEWNADYGLLEGQFRLWRIVRALLITHPTWSKLYTQDAGFGLALLEERDAGNRIEARVVFTRAAVMNYTRRALDRKDSWERHYEIEPFWWEATLSARLFGVLALDVVDLYRHERFRVLNREASPPVLWELTDTVDNRWRVRARVERPPYPTVRIELAGRDATARRHPFLVGKGSTYREVSADWLRGRTRLYARAFSGARRYRPTDVNEDRYDERGAQFWLSGDVWRGYWLGARFERRDTSRPVFPPVKYQFGVTAETRFGDLDAPERPSGFPAYLQLSNRSTPPPAPSASRHPVDAYFTFTFLTDRPGTAWGTWDRLFSLNLQTQF